MGNGSSCSPGVVLRLEVDHLRQTMVQHITERYLPELQHAIDVAVSEVTSTKALESAAREAAHTAIETLVRDATRFAIREALERPDAREVIQKTVAHFFSCGTIVADIAQATVEEMIENL